MPIDFSKYKIEKSENKIPTVWKFIISYALLQLIWNSLTVNFIAAVLYVIVSWGLLLFLPCLLKYFLKINFSKKASILYIVLSGIFFIICNCIIDIFVKDANPSAQTTTIWNLLMIITPYYILTNEPIFSKVQKDASNTSHPDNIKEE